MIIAIEASHTAHQMRAFYHEYDQEHRTDQRPVCYEIVAHSLDGTFKLGKVITPLPLEDWAVLHQYKKVEVRGLPRPAREGEKTDLQ